MGLVTGTDRYTRKYTLKLQETKDSRISIPRLAHGGSGKEAYNLAFPALKHHMFRNNTIIEGDLPVSRQETGQGIGWSAWSGVVNECRIYNYQATARLKEAETDDINASRTQIISNKRRGSHSNRRSADWRFRDKSRTNQVTVASIARISLALGAISQGYH